MNQGRKVMISSLIPKWFRIQKCACFPKKRIPCVNAPSCNSMIFLKEASVLAKEIRTCSCKETTWLGLVVWVKISILMCGKIKKWFYTGQDFCLQGESPVFVGAVSSSLYYITWLSTVLSCVNRIITAKGQGRLWLSGGARPSFIQRSGCSIPSSVGKTSKFNPKVLP